jgi:large subunit ribosomal protein L21
LPLLAPLEALGNNKIMPETTTKTKKESASVGVSEFAVIQTGGKQYKVSVGDVLKIEKMPGVHKAGDTISFDKVLLVDNGKDTTIGTPFIAGAKVDAIFENEGRAKKVVVIRYKAKSKFFKKNGHRQPFYTVKIKAIQ